MTLETLPGRLTWLLAAALCAGTLAPVPRAAAVTPPLANTTGGPPVGAVLELPDDGFVQGDVLPAAAADGRSRTTLLWKSALFETPLEFAIDEIARIRFPPRPAPAPRPGAWRFDLRGGDLLIGMLEAIDGDSVTVDAGAASGPLRIKRSWIERMTALAGDAQAIVPGRLDGWAMPQGGWEEHAGSLTCSKPGATAVRAIDAPARACYDLRLSWDDRPDFDLAFAVAPGAADRKAAEAEIYRLEANGGDLLAIREGGVAKFDVADGIAAGAGRLRLQVFVDQERGRLAVVVPEGELAADKPIFDETLAPRKASAGGGVAVKLRKGNLRIDSLRVSDWSGAEARLEGDTGLGGPTARLESFDRATGEFVVRDGAETRRVAATAVPEIEFPEVAAPQPGEPQASPVLIAFADGSRLTGALLDITATAIRIDSPMLAAPLAAPREQIVSVEAVGPRGSRPLPGRIGLLETPTCRMLGCLVNPAAGRGLSWQPRGCVGPVPFGDPPAAARITYRGIGMLGGVGIVAAKQGTHWVVTDMPAGEPAARDGRLEPGWRIEAIAPVAGGAFVPAEPLRLEEMRALLRGVSGSAVQLKVADAEGRAHEIVLVRDAQGRGDLAGARERDVLDKALALQDTTTGSNRRPSTALPKIYLKTGDSLYGTVLSADAEGIRVKTDLADNLLIPAVAVRAVELLESDSKSITKEKLARLLTLPRLQQADPPTHMLRLVTGDYIRCKLLSLDERQVRVRVLEETKVLSRADVARLIWLSVAGDGSPPQPLAAVGGAAGLPVQGLMTDKRRLTLAAERLEGDRLLGTSGILGAAGIDLGGCTSLLVGPAIQETDRATLPYGQWILTPAPPPKVLQEAAGSGG